MTAKTNELRKGVAFTISIIIFSITLLALASFAKDWKNDFSSSVSPLSSSGNAQAPARISSALGDLLRTSAYMEKKDNSTVEAAMLLDFPFKREGMPLADMNAISSGLAQSLQGTGLEATLSPEINGSRAVVAKLAGGGYILESNNGSYDMATLYHPYGMPPESLEITAVCEKNASTVGEFESSTAESDLAVHYTFNLTDGKGANFIREAYIEGDSNASIAASFTDGAILFADSKVAEEGENYTAIQLSKSPGAQLVLPFDANDSNHRTQNYAPYSWNAGITGSIMPDDYPIWRNYDCPSGGCYSLTSNNVVSAIFWKDYADLDVRYMDGPQLLANGGFEELEVGSYPDDYNEDEWTWWQFSDIDAMYNFYSSTENADYNLSLLVDSFGVMSDEYIYQEATGLNPNRPYTLSFMSNTSCAEYRIYDPATAQYFDGEIWGPDQHTFNSEYLNGDCMELPGRLSVETVIFALPEGSTSVMVELVAPLSGKSYFIDTVTLTSTEGLNGGFDYYVLDEGVGGVSYQPEVQQVYTQRDSAPTCGQKWCNTSMDCNMWPQGGWNREKEAPYCNLGCNLETHTCYPDPDGQAFCRGVNQSCPGYPSLSCCPGAYCDSVDKVCYESVQCDGTCSISSECAPGCGYCAEPACGGASSCQACIPLYSPSACTANDQCCGSNNGTGFCDLDPQSDNFQKCIRYLAVNQTGCSKNIDCMNDEQEGEDCVPVNNWNGSVFCKKGACRVETSPLQPPTPVLDKSTAYANDTIRCIENCPPIPRPIDPDLDGPLSVGYLWYKNGQLVNSVSGSYLWQVAPSISCGEIDGGCGSGDNITLAVMVCDPYGTFNVNQYTSICTVGCNVSEQSLPATLYTGTDSLTCSSAPQSACGIGVGECCGGRICKFDTVDSSVGSCCIVTPIPQINPISFGNLLDTACDGSSVLTELSTVYANPSLACSSDQDCCSGKCQEGYCTSFWGAGHTCQNSTECDPSAPFCSKNQTIDSVCNTCIRGHPTIIEMLMDTNCTKQSDCCEGAVCDLDPSSVTYSKCSYCLYANQSCSFDSDCCSGSCIYDSASKAKRCVPQDDYYVCSGENGKCTSDGDCCQSPTVPEDQFCDTLNRYPPWAEQLLPVNSLNISIGNYGSCRTCYPSYARCDPDSTFACCDGDFSCQQPGTSDNYYCLPSGSFSPERPYFYGWAYVNDPSISVTSFMPDGSDSLEISGNSDSYIYSTSFESASRGNKNYLLEFWTQAASSGIRYSIFDEHNNAFFNSTNEWQYMNLSEDGTTLSPDVILDSGWTSSDPYYVSNVFTTLANAKIQVRFYPPNTGAASLDSVEVTELRDITVSAWVRNTGQSPAPLMYYPAYQTFPLQNGGIKWWFMGNGLLNMSFNGVNYSYSYPDGFDQSVTEASVNADDGNWHHVALTLSRTGGYSAYLDGEPVASGQTGRLRIPSRIGFMIGGESSEEFPSGFNGDVDDVRFYSRALSSGEIADLYGSNPSPSCKVMVKATYSGQKARALAPSSTYNSRLIVRKLPSSTLLSLPFDNNASNYSSGAVADYSSSLASCYNRGAVWLPSGKVGGAFNFSDQASAVICDKPIMPATGDFAFSAWVKPASNSGAQYVMGTVNANNPEGVGLLLSGDGTVALFDKITTTTFISTLTAPPNQWTFIVAGRKQGIGYIYVNTLPNPTCDHCIQEAMSGYSNFSIGNDPDFTYPPFDGQIDEVRVFNSFPSEDEIYSLYQDSMVSYDSSPPTRYPLAPSDFGLGGQD